MAGGKRMVVVDIETICNLFKDYCGEVGFPKDGKPVKLLFHPQERKLAILVEADSLSGDQPAEEVRFDLQKSYILGGTN